MQKLIYDKHIIFQRSINFCAYRYLYKLTFG